MLYHIICCDHDFYVAFPSPFHSSDCLLPSPFKKFSKKKEHKDVKTIADYTFNPALQRWQKNKQLYNDVGKKKDATLVIRVQGNAASVNKKNPTMKKY